ncbi:MAG: asparagine synthase (glutamine-hydrolyzing) [Nitrospirota bacterium]|nr:asparagine synthase (glutamine-hydrolyzing) [Nitrospirota bacterium]
MCGIAGSLQFSSNSNNYELQATTLKMSDMLVHRGPDDSGIWVDDTVGVALGHRRLSILDLSPEGHQPMVSACGRYVIAFNGEVYNYLEIRMELEGQSQRIAPGWRGHSDTEVMLAAISRWGIEAAVRRFVGMFAFALWDREERSLHLVRDRMGEKPLYYGWVNGTFLFGSELKALRAHPAFRAEIDRDALALFLRHNYIPAPYSIYRNIFKLIPGTILTIRAASKDSRLSPVAYWSVKECAEAGERAPFEGTEEEAVACLESLISSSVRQQMVADVPLGAFLSGGIDSSTVVALMQAQSDRPVKTFTIGFEEKGYNEALHAKEVAQHLGTDHTELYVTPAEARDVIPRLPALYDEPFSDSSQIPTFLVSQMARRHVTVSLSGDGGDELFGGYNRYFWGRSIWNKTGWLPVPARKVTASALTALSPRTWDALFDKGGGLLPRAARVKAPGDKLHKLAEVLPARNPETIYKMLVSHWKNPAAVVIAAKERPTVLTDEGQWADLADFTHRMMYLDMMTYLPDDILVKVDRASMGVSLESRVPFLDHRVVEFAWRIPLKMKIRNNEGKWILRQVLYKHVPRELMERPKMGFGVPIDEWLRGPLKEWAEALLDEKRLRDEGYFDPRPIREKWQEHLSGARNWQYYLWDVLMFQVWLEHQ